MVHFILQTLLQIKLIDFLSCILSLLVAWTAARGYKITWTLSFFACLFNGVMWSMHKVYGHAFLDCYYLSTIVLGWAYWSKKTDPQNLARIQQTVLFVLLALVTFFLYKGLIWMEGSYPLIDAFGTGAGLFAQILTCFKYKEAWLLWILHDLANGYTAQMKGLWLTASKQICYLGIAFYGWKNWDKCKKQ